MKFNRRDFLWSSASLAAVAASERLLLAQTPAPAPTPAPTGRGNPTNRLNVAVIGIRGRGREHLDGIAGRHNCVVTHVCDVDTATQNERAVAAKLTAITARQGGVRPEFVQDLRRIMDNPNIHSSRSPRRITGTASPPSGRCGRQARLRREAGQPQHLGRPAARRGVAALQQDLPGRDADPQLGRRPARRSSSSAAAGSASVKIARGLCYKRRHSIGTHMGEVAIPATVDYDLWCGPAPRRPMNRTHLHYDWHWQWDYGNGDLGNQGIHQMDVARWGLGKSEPLLERLVGRRPLRLHRRRRDRQHAARLHELRRRRRCCSRSAASSHRQLRRQARGGRRQRRQRLPLRQRLPRLHQLRSTAIAYDKDGDGDPALHRRRRSLRQLRRGRPGQSPRGRCTARSRKGICRAPCAIWRTSAIVSASRRRSRRSRPRSAATPSLTRRSSG